MADCDVGEVYLIGAGPGAPDLLTLRAVRLLQTADVVLYDRLVTPAVLDMASSGAERIYVGKQRNLHHVPQEGINALLIRLAREGKRVARLKGGDPFIFGRGGEELETLLAAGIPFEIVPGVTAASGAAAYAGIPLTHRDFAQSCVFVTGHRRADGLSVDFAPLVRANQTTVFYMGLQVLPDLCRGLIEHGAPPDRPAAIVQQATTANQKVVVGTLATLPELAEQEGMEAPTIIIVGDVVRLHDKLAWFEAARATARFWPAGGGGD